MKVYQRDKQRVAFFRGKLWGTTYSGHPISTSSWGTGRNLFYNNLPNWLDNFQVGKTMIDFEKYFK